MKKLVIGLLVVIVLGGIVFASIRAKGGDKGESVYAEPVARRDLAQVVKATGELQPRIQVNISAHVIGKIEQLYVQEGDLIQKGQPFLRLEQQAFLAQRDQWAAQLRSAQTAVRQAEVSLADARVKLARAKTSERARGSPPSRTSRRRSSPRPPPGCSSTRRSEAVRQTRANLVKAQDDLTKTTIYSPLTGRVIALNAKEGEVVVSGTMNNPGSVIGTIADLPRSWPRWTSTRPRSSTSGSASRPCCRVDALPGREYTGKVVEVGSSGYNRANQPDVTFFKVKILLDRSRRQPARPDVGARRDPHRRPRRTR